MNILPTDVVNMVNNYKNQFETNDKLFDYLYYNIIDCYGKDTKYLTNFDKAINNIFKIYNSNIIINYDMEYNIVDAELVKDCNEIISKNLLIAIINYIFNLPTDHKFLVIDNDRLIEMVVEFNTLVKELKSKIYIILYYDKYEASLEDDDKSENENIVNNIFDYIYTNFPLKSDIGYYEGQKNINNNLNNIFIKNGSNMIRLIINEINFTEEDKKGYRIESILYNNKNNITIGLVMDLFDHFLDQIYIGEHRLTNTNHFNEYAKAINSKVRIINYEGGVFSGICQTILIKI